MFLIVYMEIFKTAKFEEILKERFREKRLWIFSNKNLNFQPFFCLFVDSSDFLTDLSPVSPLFHRFGIE